METDLREFDHLNAEAGKALAACGPRKKIRWALKDTALGSSKTRIHQQVHGDPTGWLQRSCQAVRHLARTPGLNPYPPIRQQLLVAQEARSMGLDPATLAGLIMEDSKPETDTQAAEDVAQQRLTQALWIVAFHDIDHLTDEQRNELVAALKTYREAAIQELDAQLALVGDVSALLKQLAP